MVAVVVDPKKSLRLGSALRPGQVPPELVAMDLPGLSAGEYRIHVWGPALERARKNPRWRELPMVAIREPSDQWSSFRLFLSVEINTKSTIRVEPDKALPGTGGKGLAVLYTAGPVRCYYASDEYPIRIDAPEGSDVRAVDAKVVSYYKRR